MFMQKQKLKEKFQNKIHNKLGINALPLLYEAVLDETCEVVSEAEVSDGILFTSLLKTYLSSLKLLSSFLKGILEKSNSSQITLSYRGGKFIIKNSDPLLKYF